MLNGLMLSTMTPDWVCTFAPIKEVDVGMLSGDEPLPPATANVLITSSCW